MDATVAAALTSQLESFETGAYAQITSVLPVAIPIAITIGLVFFGWRIFRAMAHV